MIDMKERWSDGWKAGNVLQIYEKAVVIFAVGFFPFFTTDNLGNRRINGLYFAKSSTYVLDVVWYFIIPIIDLGIEQEFLCLGQEKRNATAFRHKENMVWFRSGDRNSCHFDRFVYQYIYLYTGTYCGAEWGADGSQCK